jgi:hypothetical protein
MSRRLLQGAFLLAAVLLLCGQAAPPPPDDYVPPPDDPRMRFHEGDLVRSSDGHQGPVLWGWCDWRDLCQYTVLLPIAQFTGAVYATGEYGAMEFPDDKLTPAR